MSSYDTNLDKNSANYVPLTPLTFLERAKDVYPNYEAIVYEDRSHINLDKKFNEISKDVDFSELCITSSAEVSYLENSETKVETTKAAGSKCQLCWKITKDACSRKTCPQQTE